MKESGCFSKKSFSVFHTVSGSGTIKGSVKQDNGSALSGVSVSFAIYGSTVDNTTTNSSGDFRKSLNSLGIYTLTYSKSGYLGATQSATLATYDQTLVVGTLSQLAEGCLAGTVSGTITDAVSGNTVSGVSLSIRSGVNVNSGSTTGITATTDSSGKYSFSSMSAGCGILFRPVNPDTRMAILTSSHAAELLDRMLR